MTNLQRKTQKILPDYQHLLHRVLVHLEGDIKKRKATAKPPFYSRSLGLEDACV
jgi:hypothetical protein